MFNYKQQEYSKIGLKVEKCPKIMLSYNNTLLRSAVRGNDIKTVKELVRKGADVNHMERNESTLLHDAAQEGHHEIVKFLIENGATVDATLGKGKNRGFTPLHLAVQKNHFECVKILLQKGASVSPKIEGICHPIHLAVSNDYPEILELLLENGADANQRFSNKFFEEYKPKILRSLWLDHNLPLIHYAILQNFKKIFFILHDYSVDFNSKTNLGKTALMQAVETNDINLVKLLIKEKNADVNARDIFGKPVIHFVVLNANREISMYNMEDYKFRQEKLLILKYLINFGVNVNARFPEDDKRGAIVHYMFKFGFYLGVKFLFEYSIDFNFNEIDSTSIQSIIFSAAILSPDENGSRIMHGLARRLLNIIYLIIFQARALQAIGYPVNNHLIVQKSFHHLIRTRSFESRLNKSQKEVMEQIEFMKENRIEDSNITLWFLMTCDTTELVRLMSNEFFRDSKVFENNKYIHLSYFYTVLGKRLHDARRRKMFLEEFTEFISSLLINLVPFDCCRKIVNYLNTDDIIVH